MNYQYLLALFITTLVVCSGRRIDSEEPSDEPMQNPDLFEGDILGIDPDVDRNAVVQERRVWPNGRIPYIIDDELKAQEPLIKKAMNHYKEKTCIRFVPRIDEELFIRIYPGKGCNSHVGRSRTNQSLSLGKGCYIFGTIVHELGHAIGFYHEQSRSDRDDHLNIHYENIKPGLEGQFFKLKPTQNRLFTPFDFDSIMLYGELTFSKDRKAGLKTMTAKDGRKIIDTHKKPGLSKADIIRISKMYKC